MIRNTELFDILISILMILFMSGCDLDKKPTFSQEKAKKSTSFKTINDSTWSERIYDSKNITIELINSSSHYNLEISKNGKIKIINFDKENIPAKTPELEWSNNNFANLVTWWSLGFSRNLFIDLNNINKFIFIDKDILLSDKESNNIVYIDTVYNNSAILKLEDLVSRKQKPIILPFDDKNSIYPFYNDIKFEGDQLIITLSRKKIKSKILK